MNQGASFEPLRQLDQMASLISEVTGEPAGRVIEKLEIERRHPGETVARDFARHGGQPYEWGSHLESFYGSTDAFLYELVVWNRNSLKASMRRWVTRHMALQGRPLDVLSVGDGLGFDCLHLARKSHRVTYFELPGISEAFARKLFDRSGFPIPILTDPAAIARESFDAITCFDVLEHVPDPPATVRELASYLRPGGLLYVSAPFYMIRRLYPTHLRRNRRFSGSLELYRQAGLHLVGGEFTWYPIVVQKTASPGPAGRSFESLLVRATGAVQVLGRFCALPFFPIHTLRRMCNRPYKECSSGVPA